MRNRAAFFQSLVLVAACAAPLPSWAQDAAPVCPSPTAPPSPEKIQEAQRNAKDHGFLWRVTKGGHTSYLYGTMHVGRFEWLFPGSQLTEAVRASDSLALELDVMDPELMKRFQDGIAPKKDRGLPKALETRLRKQLQAACLPDAITTTMAPEMVAATLTVMAGRKEGLDPSYGVDAFYAGLARQLKKPVASLETPELQLKLLLGSSPKETADAVDSALKELEDGTAGAMLARMAQMWAEGRFKELETYEQWCKCLETERDRETMRKMLNERNPGLASGIDAIHSSGKRVFAAVGSLHMVGEMGLPSLLAKKGYAVERVELNPKGE